MLCDATAIFGAGSATAGSATDPVMLLPALLQVLTEELPGLLALLLPALMLLPALLQVLTEELPGLLALLLPALMLLPALLRSSPRSSLACCPPCPSSGA